MTSSLFRVAALSASLLMVGLVAVAPSTVPAAHAAIDCETQQPDSYFKNTSMEFVYAAQGAIGGTATIDVQSLCVSGAATVTELSNADGVAVVVTSDPPFSTITLTAPAVDFEGIARVDLEITDGPLTFVLELYGLFGVTPTSFPFDRPDPVVTAVSTPAFFPIAGIVPRAGATIVAEIVRSTQAVTVEWVDAPEPGIRVTPPAGYLGPLGVEVMLTDGITAEVYTVVQWAGVPIPTTAVWAPNPPPVAIDPGGTGYFDIGGSFVPTGSACGIAVTTVPDIDIVTEPPSLNGIAFSPIGVGVLDPDFVGLLTVSYDLECELPDLSIARVQYDFVLYVGIPIPELAATGADVDVVPLGAGALALMLGGFVLVRRRVISTSRSR